MKRFWTIAACALLAGSLAAPAMAKDHSIGGFLMVKGVYQSMDISVKERDPDTYLDQRFRAKWDMNLNEYVKVVYYGEVDFQYGDSSYEVGDAGRGRNGGGAIGGDQANIETKHLYMDVKIPETPASFRLGLQGVAAPDYALFLFDCAGLTINAKADMFDAQFGYFKLHEGDTGNGRGETIGATAGEDDATFVYLRGSAKPMDALKVGAGLYYVWNQGHAGSRQVNFAGDSNNAASFINSDFNQYILLVDGSYKLDMITIEGWATTTFGTVEGYKAGGGDLDLGGFAATVKVSGKTAGIGWGARALYWSGDDDVTDDVSAMYTPFGDVNNIVKETLPFAKDGLMLMMADGMQTTVPSGGFRGYAAELMYEGYGLIGLTAMGSFTPPNMKKVTIKGALAHFMTVEDEVAAGDPRADLEGTTVGTEIAVRANYQLVESVTVSLNGAYAMLGDAFDGTAGGDDPDNPFTLYWAAKVAF